MKELDVVALKDGRTGTILEVFKDGEAYMLDIVSKDGKTLDTPIVPAESIEKVIYKHE